MGIELFRPGDGVVVDGRRGIRLKPRKPVPELPTDGLVWHVDASQLTGLSDNDPVTTWDDLVGSEDLTASGDHRPTYNTGVKNGLPAVTFSSGGGASETDEMVSAGKPLANTHSDFTFFLVYQLTNNPPAFYLPLVLAKSNGSLIVGFIQTNDAGSPRLQFTPDTQTTTSVTENLSTNTWLVLVGRHSNAADVTRGTQIIWNGNNGPEENATADFLAGGIMRIGGPSAAGVGADFVVAEAGVYDKRFNDQEVSDATVNLANKWGISL